jgi:hypothetical protein
MSGRLPFKLDASLWFGPALEQLRYLYGDEVELGAPIDPDALGLLERELGVTLPADYRAFLATYGFLRVRDAIIYGLPTSTTRDADLVRVRRDAARGVVTIVGDGGGAVYTLDAADLDRCDFRDVVRRLAKRLEDACRTLFDDDATPYRRLIPVSAVLASSIEADPSCADDVALEAAHAVELRRHVPALLEIVPDIARAMCGDRDLRGPEMPTRLFTPSEVNDLAAGLANIVEDVRAAGAEEAVVDLAVRVRDAYLGASQANGAMMIRYSRI